MAELRGTSTARKEAKGDTRDTPNMTSGDEFEGKAIISSMEEKCSVIFYIYMDIYILIFFHIGLQ